MKKVIIIFILCSKLLFAMNTIVLNLTYVQRLQYISTLKIGSNEQPFSLVMDSGSYELWFKSKKCTKCESFGLSDPFDCSQSKTCNESKSKHLKILQYGIGKVEGKPTYDSIKIGEFSIKKHKFYQAVKTKDFDAMKADGILGIGLRQNSAEYPTLIENLKKNKIISKAMYSLFLTNAPCKSNSQIVIGKI